MATLAVERDAREGQQRSQPDSGRSPGGPVGPRAWLRVRWKRIRRRWRLYVLVSVPFAFLVVFHYIPMVGAQIAFRNYNPVLGMFRSPWIGLTEFKAWLTNPDFWPVTRNTLWLSLYSLLVGTPCTIILALMLNEVRSRRFKKFVQTVTYFPYFLSVIVLVGIMQLVLSPGTGLLQQVADALGVHHIPDLFGSASDFPSLYVWSGVWQTTGYGAIIYLGVLTSVNPSLYEAARIDGASILQKIRYVDFPAIRPTIVILMVLALGQVLSVGFEKVYLLQTPLNLSTSQVISTYVYQVGLVQDNFSFGAAVGLFNALVGLILIVIVNFAARRLSNSSLF